MKKVISINFQGQVIAIEESAYEMLQAYINDLRQYFSTEECGEEIVNDIEVRIAELFSNRLKLGIECMTDIDVDNIIHTIGRPEDFDIDSKDFEKESSEGNYNISRDQQTYSSEKYEPKGLYANTNDKIIAGVCSGIAYCVGTDPTWIRLIFIIFFPILFWVYLLLWICLRRRPLKSKVKRRFYRNDKDRILGGVCSGLATYFKIDLWIPRLIFLMPFILEFSSWFFSIPSMRSLFGKMWPSFWFNFSFLFIYVILWIIVPRAKTMEQKLEMLGEDEYLRSIRDDVAQSKQSKRNRSKHVKEKFGERQARFSGQPESEQTQYNKQRGQCSKKQPQYENWQENFKEYGQSAAEQSRDRDTRGQSRNDEQYMAREPERASEVESQRSGFANVLIILLKVLLFFVVGIAAIVVLVAFFGFLFGTVGIMPFKSLFIDRGVDNVLLYAFIILSVCVPIATLIYWIVRVIMKAPRSPKVGVVTVILWVVGIVCGIFLSVRVVDKYKVETAEKTQFLMNNAVPDTLFVDVRKCEGDFYQYKTFKHTLLYRWQDEYPYMGENNDFLYFDKIFLRLIDSTDSLFHVDVSMYAHGNNKNKAKEDIRHFQYNITQQDSLLSLPEYFSVPKEQGYRCQRISVEIAVPVDKQVSLLGQYCWSFADRRALAKIPDTHMRGRHPDDDDEDEYEDDEDFIDV